MQKEQTNNNAITIAVVSDIEGAIDNANKTAEKIANHDLDLIIVAGDCYENEKIRSNPQYPNSTNNTLEMILGITPFIEFKIPILIIPGNHEDKYTFNKAIGELKNINNKTPDISGQAIDLKGVNIVGLGGYHDERFIPEDGFLITKEDYDLALKQLQQLQSQHEPTIFVTHGPPKSDGTIDLVPNIGNVGDEELAKILDSGLENIINVHGHIHESGKNQQLYKSGISINVASVTDYNNPQAPTALILEINGKNVESTFI